MNARLRERGLAAYGYVERRSPRAVSLAREWIRRFVEIEAIDRAVVLAAQAFTALFPLMIVYASVAPRASGRDFADGLIDRFHLDGAAAASVRRAFAPSSEVSSSVTIIGVLILIGSALTFTRALQRTYERSWRLPKLGMHGTGWGLAWLAAMGLAYSIRPALGGSLDSVVGAASSLAIAGVIWLVTPYLLLARRVDWHKLVPSALLTGGGMTVLGIASLIYVPRSVAASADRFGVIGVAFALLGWLIAAGFVITLAATGGAVLAEPRGRESSAPNDRG